MHVALAARVSTDQDQNPKTQLQPLRKYLLHLQAATDAGTGVDQAIALPRWQWHSRQLSSLWDSDGRRCDARRGYAPTTTGRPDRRGPTVSIKE